MAATDSGARARFIGRTAQALIPIVLLLIASVVLRPAETHSEEYGAAQAYVHAFNNNVTVFSTVFALNKEFSLNTSVYGKYTVDVIRPGLFDGEDGGDAVSGASSATVGGGNDSRHELTAGVSHNFPGIFGVELYYDYSREKDYTSNTPTITIRKELFNKNTTLSFGYSRNMDEVSGEFLKKAQDRTTDNFYFGLTQVISPFTIVQAGYTYIVSDGYLAEGIRLVPVDGVTADTCTAKSATCLEEAFPGSRRRNAYTVGVNHYFAGGSAGDGFASEWMGQVFNRSSVKLTFRYYHDDWDISSYTGEIEYFKYLSDADLLRLNFRYYDQTAASFFKETYLSSDQLRTISPQHRDFSSSLAGVRVTHRLSGGYVLGPLELGSVEGKYELYVESSRVNAHIFMANLKFAF